MDYVLQVWGFKIVSKTTKQKICISEDETSIGQGNQITPVYRCKTHPVQYFAQFCQPNTNQCWHDLMFKNVCIFNNLNLDEQQIRFEPTSDLAQENVTEVDFGGWYHDSQMLYMTKDVCEAFLNVKKIQATHLGLRHIQADAFKECIELEVISLAFNSLETLGRNVFDSNSKLKELDVGWNQLQQLEASIFTNLISLRKLDVSGNLLREFPIRKIRELNSMTVIKLGYNRLTELNEKKVFEKFPKLKYFFLCPNQGISVTDVNDIFDFFDQKMIQVNTRDCHVNIKEEPSQ